MAPAIFDKFWTERARRPASSSGSSGADPTFDAAFSSTERVAGDFAFAASAVVCSDEGAELSGCEIASAGVVDSEMALKATGLDAGVASASADMRGAGRYLSFEPHPNEDASSAAPKIKIQCRITSRSGFGARHERIRGEP